MAFPTIPTVAAGRILTNNQADTTATRTFPNLSGLTKNAGDLLIAIVVGYQTGTGTNAAFSGWTSGWTEFHDSATSTTLAIGMAYKWSTGSETGTISVTQAGTITGHASMMLLSIPGAHATSPPEAGSRVSGTGTAADPGSFNPTGWDVADTLWIAVGANGMVSATGNWDGVKTAPANYTDIATTNTADNSTVGQTELSVAFRQLAAASEDVGPFEQDLSNARHAHLIIAVRPAEAMLYGATAMLVTFEKAVAAEKQTFGQIAAPFTFTKTVSGIASTKTSVAEISLASHGTPSERTNHSIKVRARTTTGSTGVIKAALYEGATNRSGDLISSLLTTSLADYTLAIADVDAEDITDYSNLSIRFWGFDSTGAALVFEVAEVYLELPEATGPITYFGATSAAFTFGKNVDGVASKKTSVAEISLASHGTPSERTNHSIKVRARTTSGSTGIIKAALYEGSTNRSGDLSSSALTNSLADYTLTIADVDAEDITDYSNLSIRFWGFDTAGNALVFEVANIYLELPEAGAATYYGVVVAPLTFTKEVSATRKTFSTTITALTFTKAVSGQRLTFAQIARPFTFVKDVAGRKQTFGAVVRPFTFVKDVSGKLGTFGQIVSPFTFVKDVAGSKQTFGAVVRPFTFVKDVAGRRTAFGVLVRPFTFVKDVSARRTTFGQTAASFTFGKAVAGVGTIINQISTSFTFNRTVTGSRRTFSQIASPFTFTKAVLATKKTFGVVAAPFIFVKETSGKLSTFGQITRPFTFVKDVAGRKETFGSVVRPFTFVKSVSGARQTFGQIVAPFTFVKSVVAQRTTFGQTSTTFTFNRVISGVRTALGQIAASLTFVRVVSGTKQTFGQIVAPFTFVKNVVGIRTTLGQIAAFFTFNRIVSGHKTTFARVDLPLIFTDQTSGRKETFGNVGLPINITFDVVAEVQGIRFGQTSMSLVFDKDISGTKETFGQVDAPYFFERSIQAVRTTFSGFAFPFTFFKDTRGQRQTFGSSIFPINATIVVGGTTSSNVYGQVALSLVFGEQTIGYRKTFGQIARPYTFDADLQGMVETFGSIDFPVDFIVNVNTGRVEALSSLSSEFLLALETAGIIRPTDIVLNLAKAIYLGSTPVDAVYVDEQKVWPQ